MDKRAAFTSVEMPLLVTNNDFLRLELYSLLDEKVCISAGSEDRYREEFSGLAAITSRVWVPIEPVELNMATLFSLHSRK